jgi:Transposase domain (DUF772)/Transposase DDE domain
VAWSVLSLAPIRWFVLWACGGQTPGHEPHVDPSDAQLDAASWCRHLVPDGSVYAFLADHREQLFPPELFADLVVQGRSHPSVPTQVVAMVMVLQALEGLSDREAASALRRDIAWKVACGLRLDDEGFHPTVLVYWRARLRASQRPRRIFEAVRQVVEATGVLAGRGRRVLDSTILADAVATQDTVTQLVAAVRRVRRLVPVAREVKLAAHDYERPGKPDCAWDDPQATQALVSGLVNDALAVLDAVAEVELDATQGEAVALLALVAGQDVEPGQRPGSWQIARKVAKDRVISTVDPQARHARKTSTQRRDGYKGHIAAEPETGLVTECALTAANLADGPTGLGLLAGEEPGLEVLGDSGYGAGRPARRWRLPATARRSSRCRLPARCRAGSPSTTSASTGRLASSGARPARSRRSAAPVGSASRASVAPARCGDAAPPPRVAARSTCTRMRTSCAPPAAARPHGASSTAIGAGGRWWNARWLGWSPMAAGGCPTAASTATSCGGRCGSPRSTCAGCWHLA